ncbi:ubiquitin-like protein, putative [Trypanosoma equiperdum]|uniref:Ubiquitin-like protein, putative n=1 Tax=Trypanosoma equiperdum TaxID=5694 RepID=A0A1G4I4G4_TRYEQ|nr:ubiquitin-like protein, putative [Trypanosoma equiperdum]
MHINVSGARPEHTINGLEVDVEEGVEGLRRRIGERLGAPPEQLRLIHMGQLIDGSRPLSSFLQDGTTVHVVVSPGAANNNTSGDARRGVSGGMDITASIMSPTGLTEFLTNIIPDIRNASTGNARDGVPVMMSIARTMLPAAVQAFSRFEGTQTPQQTRTQSQNQTQQSQQPQEEPQAGQQHMQTHHQSTRVLIGRNSSTPEPTSLHIHLHVTTNDLDELPDRLERLGRRIYLPSLSVSTHVEPTSEISGNHRSSEHNAGRTADAAAPHSNENNTTEADEDEIVSDGLILSLLGQLASTTRGNPPNDGEFGTHGLGNLLIRSMIRENPTAFLGICVGNWESFAHFQSRISEVTTQWLAAGRHAGPVTPEERQRRIEQEADRLARLVAENLELVRAFEQERRPNIDVAAELRRFVIYAHETVIGAIVNPHVSGSAWAQGVRTALVFAGGIAMDRASTWFTRGAESLTRLAGLVARAAVQQFTSLDQSTAEQLAAIIDGTLPTTLLELQQEYQSLPRPEGEPGIFNETASVTTTSEGANANELLDICLEEFCEGGPDDSSQAVPDVPPDGYAGELEGALRALGTLPDDAAEDMMNRAQRFCHEAPTGRTGERSSMWKQLERR